MYSVNIYIFVHLATPLGLCFRYWCRSVQKRLEKLSSIEDGGQTNRITVLPCPYVLEIDLDLQSQVSCGHDPHTKKFRGQLAQTIDWKQTACRLLCQFTFLVNAVGTNRNVKV